MPHPFFRSVHHLRAVAALAICLLHAGFPWFQWQLEAGVSLFFVISGFVIFMTYRTTTFDPADYAWRRFIRIMPLWWIALFWFAGFTIHFGLGWHVDWPYLLKSLVLLPTQNAQGELRPYLNVGWTLIYEVFFYALYGIATWLGRWWLCTVAIVALVLTGWIVQPAGFLTGVYTDDIMLGFAAGCHIAQARCHGFRFHPVLLPIGVAMLMTLPQVGATLPCCLILAGGVSLEDRWPDLRPLSFLGAASYAIYLFHFSVTYLAERAAPSLHWAAVFVLATALGCVVHVLVEKPLTTYLRNRRPRLT
jgi:exopolysaccharide production protein ExoZ